MASISLISTNLQRSISRQTLEGEMAEVKPQVGQDVSISGNQRGLLSKSPYCKHKGQGSRKPNVLAAVYWTDRGMLDQLASPSSPM